MIINLIKMGVIILVIAPILIGVRLLTKCQQSLILYKYVI